jgi:predicted PhzF superfamily epimerase YddE/YHI9
MLAIQAGEFVWCGVFSSCLRDGNPAFVIRLQSWPDDSELGFITAFMGHVEIAFVILENNNLQMRWFAGAHEVPLCGHAALAANAVFLSQMRNGELLPVLNIPGRLWLSRLADEPYLLFPRLHITEAPSSAFSIGLPKARVFDAGRDYLFIVEDEDTLKRFDPLHAGLESLDKIGIIVSSPSSSATAAFRFFAPRAGILEDRASGSVIPALAEFWGSESGNYSFNQESGHNIRIRAQKLGDRVGVTGEVLEFARGRLDSTLAISNHCIDLHRDSTSIFGQNTK